MKQSETLFRGKAPPSPWKPVIGAVFILAVVTLYAFGQHQGPSAAYSRVQLKTAGPVAEVSSWQQAGAGGDTSAQQTQQTQQTQQQQQQQQQAAWEADVAPQTASAEAATTQQLAGKLAMLKPASSEDRQVAVQDAAMDAAIAAEAAQPDHNLAAADASNTISPSEEQAPAAEPQEEQQAAAEPEEEQQAAAEDQQLKVAANLEKQAPGAGKEVRKYHVLTSSETGVYQHWQARVQYYSYLKSKAECERQLGDACEMGGFTRLLTVTDGHPDADDLMDEIPTFVAQPLPNSVVEHDSYPPLDRPYALTQWLQQQGRKIPEKYVLLADPDYIFLRPLPNLMQDDDRLAAAPYNYIQPAKAENIPIIAQFMPSKKLSKEEAEKIAPIGAAPTFLSLTTLRKIAPGWKYLCIGIFKDEVANKKFGWTQDMYAFALAAYLSGIRHDLVPELMGHPPWDTRTSLSSGKPIYIAHYTYGNDYTLDGKHTPGAHGEWRFNKRDYMQKPPPRDLYEPPAAINNDMVRALIRSINEATQNIPCWDEYHKTGKRPATCDEDVPGSIYPKPPRSATTPQ